MCTYQHQNRMCERCASCFCVESVIQYTSAHSPELSVHVCVLCEMFERECACMPVTVRATRHLIRARVLARKHLQHPSHLINPLLAAGQRRRARSIGSDDQAVRTHAQHFCLMADGNTPNEQRARRTRNVYDIHTDTNTYWLV